MPPAGPWKHFPRTVIRIWAALLLAIAALTQLAGAVGVAVWGRHPLSSVYTGPPPLGARVLEVLYCLVTAWLTMLLVRALWPNPPKVERRGVPVVQTGDPAHPASAADPAGSSASSLP
jgi:hypothetical protein